MTQTHVWPIFMSDGKEGLRMRSELLKGDDADVELELSPHVLPESMDDVNLGSPHADGSDDDNDNDNDGGDERKRATRGIEGPRWLPCDRARRAVLWVRNWPLWAKTATALGCLGFIALAVLSADPNTCLFLPVRIAALADPTDLIPAGRAAPTAVAKARREFTLTLLGDSYLIDPEWNWQLNAKIKRFLSGYNVTVFNHGRRGERMKDVKTDTTKIFHNLSSPEVRAEGVWEPRLPDAVIVMTGSDVNSEIPWEYGSAEYAAHQARLSVMRYALGTA